jgi:hypothetical protein
MRLNGNLLLFGLVVGLTAFALAKFSKTRERHQIL